MPETIATRPAHPQSSRQSSRQPARCFPLAQQPTADGFFQGLNACLHLHLGYLPQALRTRLVAQHGTGPHELTRGWREPGQACQDHHAHGGRQQLAPGLLLRQGRGHVPGRLQLPGATGSQPWHQQLPVPQQLEGLEQV